MSYTVYVSGDTAITSNIHEVKNIFSAKLYPNPATDQVLLEIRSDEEQQYTVKMFNDLGQYISTLYNGKTNEILKNYNRANLEPGMYYIRIGSNTKTETLKLSILK